MKKILTILILGMFLISSISALESLGTFKQSDCIRITQNCASCSYVNISSISNPDSSIALSNVGMPSAGNGEWNYTFCDTTNLGKYDVRGQGDKDGVDESFATYFLVTPSGNSGNSYIVFSTFVILLIYVFTFVSFFSARNIPLTIIGGMAMLFLGIYTVNNGIIIYRDTLTNYISYITIATGGILASWAALEQLEVL